LTVDKHRESEIACRGTTSNSLY